MSADPAGPTSSLTLVIPTFNGAAHLAETLDSVHAQTLPPDQVIVVDDGSTDASVDIARAHPIGAVVFEQSHRGVAVARNRGLAHAGGAWVAFLDQDDLWHPRHLEWLLGWLGDHPDEQIAFVRETPFSVVAETDDLTALDPAAGSWADVRVADDDALGRLVAAVPASPHSQVEHHDLEDLLRGPVSVTTSFVARPELLRLAGGFAPHALAMDDYWMLVNVARLQRIAHLDQPSVFYRVHVRATSRTTKLGLPFLSSAVALRWGGGLLPPDRALGADLTGKLHRHLLTELRTSSDYRDARVRRTVESLARLLWPPDGRALERRRLAVVRRAPWLRRMLRPLRRRGER